MSAKTSLGTTSNTASYLLAYSIINFIIHADESLISRLNRARLMWSLIKSNNDIRSIKTKDVRIASIDQRFREELRQKYITSLDDNPDFYIMRSGYELVLDDILDEMFTIIDEYHLVSQSMLMEIDGTDYSDKFRRTEQ